MSFLQASVTDWNRGNVEGPSRRESKIPAHLSSANVELDT